jgi:CIC family chloride channel protein
MIGGALAGSLLVAAQRVSTQKETSDYMEAIVLGDGRIPMAQTLARSASSLVTIASGGAIGREGSMVQLAALCASVLGGRLRFPIERLRLFVACGAAAGITSAYSAPIASAFFIAEIVLGSIAMESIGPILIAAVVANVAMRRLSPGTVPYALPTFPEISGPEVLAFAVMGVLLGGCAALFLQGLRHSREWFQRLARPLPVRLALGGAIVGAVSLWLPEVWGNGYSVVNDVLHRDWRVTMLLALLLAKMVAIFATAGSGAVGGVFTPALFCGCVIGELFGLGVHALWPSASAAPHAYAVTGMGAFLAAATQAPLMSILIIFEMTLSYPVMLPVMASSVVAYFVARSIGAGSMYEITVKRRKQHDEKVRLSQLQVGDLVQPAQTVAGPQADAEAMSNVFLKHPVKYLYIVDTHHRFLGVVSLKALNAVASGTQRKTVRAADLISDELIPLTQGMSLGEALQRFLEHRGERLPVVRDMDDPILLGIVDKTSLLQTYVRLSESF